MRLIALVPLAIWLAGSAVLAEEVKNEPGYRGSSCDTSPGKPLCREAERENVCMTELIHPEQPGICVLRYGSPGGPGGCCDLRYAQAQRGKIEIDCIGNNGRSICR